MCDWKAWQHRRFFPVCPLFGWERGITAYVREAQEKCDHTLDHMLNHGVSAHNGPGRILHVPICVCSLAAKIYRQYPNTRAPSPVLYASENQKV